MSQGSLFPALEFRPTYGKVSLCAFSGDLNSPPPSPGFVENLERVGVIYPIAVRALGDGSYHVIDGARRVLSCRLLAKRLSPEEQVLKGINPLAAVIFPPECTDTEALTLILNYQRSENIARDFLAIETLFRRGFTEEAIADELSMDLVTIRQRVRLLGLLPELRTAFLECRIRPGIAERLAKLSPERQAQLLPVLEDAGKLTGKDLDALTRVQAQAVVSALPFEAFNTPGVGELTGEQSTSLVSSQQPEGSGWKKQVLEVAHALRTTKKSQLTSKLLTELAEKLERLTSEIPHPECG